MENSGRFGRVETNGFVFVKKAERKFIKKIIQFFALQTPELQSVALRFGKLQKALSISFKILSDFSWLSAETRILKLADISGREAFLQSFWPNLR